MANDAINQVKLFLKQLPEIQQQIMHLRDIEELAYLEIAEVLYIIFEVTTQVPEQW